MIKVIIKIIANGQRPLNKIIIQEKMLKITLQNKLLILQFPYDKSIIKAIKTIPSRKFNFRHKFWTVNILQAEQALEILKPFSPSIDPAIQEEVKAVKRTETELKKIKSQNDINIKFKTPLFPYQKVGVAFMLKAGHALLGDEPGLGKTIQSITVCEVKKAKKILVLCPSILKDNWAGEIKQWTDKSSVVIAGTPTQRKAQWESPKNYYIANYELLLRDLELIQKIEWDYIIADEATRVSNPKAKSSKAIKKIKAHNRLALTGTPINNRPEDLWNVCDFIRPGELGSFWNFRERYCILNFWGSVASYKNLNELRNKLQRVMIRRQKSEVLKDLPPKLSEDIFCVLSNSEQKYYNMLKDEMAAEILGNQITIDNMLVKMIRLKQMTGSIELLGGEAGSSKMEALKELLKDIASNGNKTIVFTQFAKMSKIMARDLKKYNPLVISGDVKNNLRQNIIDNFNNKEEHKILIMTEAGAYGLNVQSANYVIHFDLSWSISKMIQREDRAHRVGQKKNVTVYTLMAKNTIDEYIRAVIWKKKQVSDFLIDNKDEMETSKLTKNDILNLLK